MGLLIQPLPWRVVEGRIVDTNDFTVLHGVTPDEAEFICRAVNHHNELVAALEEIASAPVSVVGHPKSVAIARAVLAKVKDQ